MDLSSIREALNGFDNATPVTPATLHGSAASPFILGAEARVLPPSAPSALDTYLDLNAADRWTPETMIDFTQDDCLEIDFPCGQPEPELRLNYNVGLAATEVLLDGVIVAMVQMRAGEGPLRASAIRLIPDLALAAKCDAQ